MGTAGTAWATTLYTPSGVGTAPAAPEAPVITDAELFWATVDAADEYQVSTRRDGGVWNDGEWSSATSTTRDLTAGLWEYRVRARNDAGTSDWSPVSATRVYATSPRAKVSSRLRVGQRKVLPVTYRWSSATPRYCSVDQTLTSASVVGKKRGLCVLQVAGQRAPYLMIVR